MKKDEEIIMNYIKNIEKIKIEKEPIFKMEEEKSINFINIIKSILNKEIK